MAQPIPLNRISSDRTSTTLAKLDAARAQHAEAILAAYALLQELQDKGVLDLLRGLLGAGPDIVTRVAEAANTPEGIAALRNGLAALKILEGIDPRLLRALADGVKTASQIGRRLGALACGLQVFGRVLISKR